MSFFFFFFTLLTRHFNFYHTKSLCVRHHLSMYSCRNGSSSTGEHGAKLVEMWKIQLRDILVDLFAAQCFHKPLVATLLSISCGLGLWQFTTYSTFVSFQDICWTWGCSKTFDWQCIILQLI